MNIHTTAAKHLHMEGEDTIDGQTDGRMDDTSRGVCLITVLLKLSFHSHLTKHFLGFIYFFIYFFFYSTDRMAYIAYLHWANILYLEGFNFYIV